MASSEKDLSITWLTLLEISMHDLKEKIENACNRLRLRIEIDSLVLSLPLQSAIYMALDGKSPYWAERAMQRLSEPNEKATLEPRFIELLKQIANARYLP